MRKDYLTKYLIFSKCLIMYVKEKNGENREEEGVHLLHLSHWKLYWSPVLPSDQFREL